MAEQQSGSNGFDQLVRNLISEIDEQDAELASLQGSYMESCKGPRAQIKEIKGRAKEEGVNMPAFNELLAQHREDRAAQKRMAAMEPDDREAFDLLEQTLGELRDTPLGEAALRKAKPKPSGDEVLDTLGA
jgi:hypothetical protein